MEKIVKEESVASKNIHTVNQIIVVEEEEIGTEALKQLVKRLKDENKWLRDLVQTISKKAIR